MGARGCDPPGHPTRPPFLRNQVLLWGCGVTVLGSVLGKIDFIRENVEAMLILVVLVSVVPILVEFLRARRRRRRQRTPLTC